jgi:hypothetical protein
MFSVVQFETEIGEVGLVLSSWLERKSDDRIVSLAGKLEKKCATLLKAVKNHEPKQKNWKIYYVKVWYSTGWHCCANFL